MHTAHTRVHTRSHSPVLGRCAGRSGKGRRGGGFPRVRGAGIPGTPRPVRPRPWRSVSRESVNTPPAAAQRRPQRPGTAAADPAFRRALPLTPPPPGPLRHPPPAGGIGAGGAQRAASAREPGLCGVWVQGHWAPRWSPRSGASPHPASAVPSQQTGSPREGAPWPLRPGQPACAPPPAGCFAKTAPGLGPRRPPGLLRSLVSLGHLGSLPTGRSQPQAGRGPLVRPPPFPLASSLWCWACSPRGARPWGDSKRL